MFSNLKQVELSRQELSKNKASILLYIPKSKHLCKEGVLGISKKQALELLDQGYSAWIFTCNGLEVGSIMIATEYEA